MVDGGRGAIFPVIFFDGDRDINIGEIKVYPLLGFKTLQLMMSEKIGVSPNQISIYLYDQKACQRTPITSKVNFSAVVGRKDCFFHVILKKSRKSKARRLRYNGLDYGDYSLENDYSPPSPTDNVVLLRRNQSEMNMNMNVLPVQDYSTHFFDQISQSELVGLNHQLQNLKIQRENFAMAMSKNPSIIDQNFFIPTPSMMLNFSPLYDLKSFPRIQETVAKKLPVCEYCENEKMNYETPSFHHCVNDPVIDFHIARAGPVNRPGKFSP